jgi:low temperature requirement protein LtrA
MLLPSRGAGVLTLLATISGILLFLAFTYELEPVTSSFITIKHSLGQALLPHSNEDAAIAQVVNVTTEVVTATITTAPAITTTPTADAVEEQPEPPKADEGMKL